MIPRLLCRNDVRNKSLRFIVLRPGDRKSE